MQALRDVSLDLLAGEVHAIVGENGAGKSTLITILTGAVQPDSGTLSIDGVPVSAARAARRARSGHCRRLPAADAFPASHGGGEPGARPRARPRRGGASTGRPPPCRALAARARRRADRSRSVRRRISRWPSSSSSRSRAPSAADARIVIMDEPTAALPARRRGTPVGGGAGAAQHAAPACCTSPIASTRCSSSPIGSRCCATASRIDTRAAAGDGPRRRSSR